MYSRPEEKDALLLADGVGDEIHYTVEIQLHPHSFCEPTSISPARVIYPDGVSTTAVERLSEMLDIGLVAVLSGGGPAASAEAVHVYATSTMQGRFLGARLV